MSKIIRYQFKKKQFDFDYHAPLDFASWAWDSKRNHICGYFVFYRSVLAALFLSILVAYGSTSKTPTYFFIYLTNLGFLIQTLNLVVSAIVPIQYLLQSANDPVGIRWTIVAKFSWFLYNATNMTSVVISVIYWSILFKPGNGLTALNFMVHGLNSIVSLTDMFLSGRPCRLMHFYHPLVVFLAYTAFSAIYWACGGRTDSGLSYIYPPLNWENLALTVPFLVVGYFVALPLLQAFLWGVHLLRDFLFLRKLDASHSTRSSKSTNGENNYAFDGEL